MTEIINLLEEPLLEQHDHLLDLGRLGRLPDHVRPVPVDNNGYGFRVPGLVSPWAKAGFIDKQVLSQDAYLKFIEALFTNGEGLDGGNGGRPDNRPSYREGESQLGDLLCDFDFTRGADRADGARPVPMIVDTVYSASGPCQP